MSQVFLTPSLVPLFRRHSRDGLGYHRRLEYARFRLGKPNNPFIVGLGVEYFAITYGPWYAATPPSSRLPLIPRSGVVCASLLLLENLHVATTCGHSRDSRRGG
jgi:hypothetical protein